MGLQEMDMIEARARRLNRDRGGQPWHELAPQVQGVLRDVAALALCEAGLLPSHAKCRGEHGFGDVLGDWSEAGGAF